MQYEPQIDGFDIEEAGRVLVNVFAPWVQDLGPSTGRIECQPVRRPTGSRGRSCAWRSPNAGAGAAPGPGR
jgi:hypothetical protein